MDAHRVNKLIAWDLHLLCIKKNEGILRDTRPSGDCAIIRISIGRQGCIPGLNEERMLQLVINVLVLNILKFIKFYRIVLFMNWSLQVLRCICSFPHFDPLGFQNIPRQMLWDEEITFLCGVCATKAS